MTLFGYIFTVHIMSNFSHSATVVHLVHLSLQKGQLSGNIFHDIYQPTQPINQPQATNPPSHLAILFPLYEHLFTYPEESEAGWLWKMTLQGRQP